MMTIREERAELDEANKRILQDLENLWKQLAQEDAKNSCLTAANEAQKEEIAALRKQQERFTEEIGRLNEQNAQKKAKMQFPFTSDPPEQRKCQRATSLRT
jgi:chromosome segregation ATPase